jgi:hypothetical protein
MQAPTRTAASPWPSLPGCIGAVDMHGRVDDPADRGGQRGLRSNRALTMPMNILQFQFQIQLAI